MMDWSPQAVEQAEQILIAIVDETYGVTEGDEWEQAREVFRRSLELEYGLEFEDADIGPGASLPAFLTLLQTSVQTPLWTLVLAAFFLGKPISENLKAWIEIGRKVRSFFNRPVYLSRNGAAVVAVEAVFEQLGAVPDSIQLLGYHTAHITDADALTRSSTEIAEAPDTLFLGFIQHIFEIEADGVVFRVSVDGRNVKVCETPDR